MPQKIVITPAYTPLTQQRLCCVPCAVQWILLRRGLPIFTQEEIGKTLDLTVPPKHRHLFPSGTVRVVAKKPILGYGSQSSTEAAAYNLFFRAKHIPLQVTYTRHSKLKKPASFIASNLKKGNDVMIITHMSALNPKKKWGHALLATAITLGRNPVVTVGDPDWDEKKIYAVPLAKILRGMTKEVGKTERGLYIFKKN